MLALALRYKERIYCQQLDGSQRITFGSGKKDTVKLLDMTEEQLSVSAAGERLNIQTRAPFRFSQGSTQPEPQPKNSSLLLKKKA